MTDAELLACEIATIWNLDGRGDLIPAAWGPGDPPPVVVVGSTSEEVDVWFAPPVDDRIRSEVRRLASGLEPSLGADWMDVLGEIVDVVVSVMPAGPTDAGPSYVLEDSVGTDAVVWTSEDTDATVLHGLMPELDRITLQPPWVVSLEAGGVAAVCETARCTADAVEAGVWTYERFRRQGHARAAVAAWAGLVADKTVFYGTSWDNVGSQGVARSLGLRQFAQTWRLMPEPA